MIILKIKSLGLLTTCCVLQLFRAGDFYKKKLYILTHSDIASETNSVLCWVLYKQWRRHNWTFGGKAGQGFLHFPPLFFSLSYSFLFLASLPFPFLCVSFHSLLILSISSPPQIQLEDLGSAVSFPSGVWGRATAYWAQKYFWCFVKPGNALVALCGNDLVLSTWECFSNRHTTWHWLPRTPVMIISQQICADLKTDPGWGWGSLHHLAPSPWWCYCLEATVCET